MTLFEASEPQPRPPGWRLVADTAGTRGFHLIERTTPDRGVVTVCGVVGRVIDSDARVITRCPDCA